MDDPRLMSRLLAFLLTLQLLVCAAAQERHAVVRLEDGSELRGTVVSMDLEQLQLRTAEGLVKIPAVRIRKCTFDTEVAEQGAAGDAAKPPDEPAPAPKPQNPVADKPVSTPPAAKPVAETAPPTESAQEPAPGKETEGTAPTPAEPAAAEDPAETEAPPADKPATKKPAAVTGDTPLAAAADEPVGRQRFHWQARVAELSDRFPWLVPSDPTQWVSMCLLLLASLSLSIYSSTRLASGENQEFGRAVVLSVWFLVTGALQVALVPVNDLSAVIMLLVNPALALLWLRVLFGLSRSAALVAFTIQLGFFVVGYGVLELLDSILRSINAPVV